MWLETSPLWLQSLRVQTYVMVVWELLLWSLACLTHQERHGTSSCLCSKDIDPASSLGPFSAPPGPAEGFR